MSRAAVGDDSTGVVLSVEEIVEALSSEKEGGLVIGGKVSADRTTVLLYRGDLRLVRVPLPWFGRARVDLNGP
jgi:hypothetical protein